ncbi:transcription initiation factor IIE subunit beta [Vararia minispora EC-137]|uniref:Transcription initiation factor IIE subunit beta n=1 Tax=Vararia minispora EC-137 TaxID=1314806 RepID=A0ACB8QP49_9AGAM|nr:transcription initiation factor IIE subunit beta [Vararia minispora EC-137]
MSKLDRDAANFKNSLAKVNTQSWHSTQASSSSVAAASANPDKKKRPKQDVVFSQPADTGSGRYRQTQLIYAAQEGPRRLSDIAMYSSTPLMEDSTLREMFFNHPSVIWDPKMELAKFKHQFDISNKTQLLTEIKRHSKGGNGLNVKLLKESWKPTPAAIEEFEKTGDVLATRAGKDGQMKHVFANELKEEDPTKWREGPNNTGLCVEKEFLDLWHSLKVPNDVDLLKQLANEGLQATAAEATAVKVPTTKKKGKKNAPRNRQAKITNLHLKGSGIDLTRNYVPPSK